MRKTGMILTAVLLSVFDSPRLRCDNTSRNRLTGNHGSGSGRAPTAPAAGAAGGDIIVGLITKTETNPFFVRMKEGAQAKADELGVKLLTGAGARDGDNEGQVTALENMVNAGAKGILITPSDTKAIVPSIKKARDKGVLVIALDTATDPQDAVDALFATNNFNAGLLIGQWAKGAMGDKKPVIATLDLAPGITVGAQRHNGFLQGYGLAKAEPTSSDLVTSPEVVCSQDTHGDQTEGQTAMENCLSKNPDINLVYTINEPAAFGAYQAIKVCRQGKDIRSCPSTVAAAACKVLSMARSRHLATVPAEDGLDGRGSGGRFRQDWYKGVRLYRHRCHADHRQAAGGRGEQRLQVWHGELLGYEVA